LIEKFEMLSLV